MGADPVSTALGPPQGAVVAGFSGCLKIARLVQPRLLWPRRPACQQVSRQLQGLFILDVALLVKGETVRCTTVLSPTHFPRLCRSRRSLCLVKLVTSFPLIVPGTRARLSLRHSFALVPDLLLTVKPAQSDLAGKQRIFFGQNEQNYSVECIRVAAVAVKSSAPYPYTIYPLRHAALHHSNWVRHIM